MTVESQHEPHRDEPPGSRPSAFIPQASFSGPPASALHASRPDRPEFPKLLLACMIVLGAAFGLAWHLQSYLDDPKFDAVLITSGLRSTIRAALPRGLPMWNLLTGTATVSIAVWLAGGTVLAIVSWTAWTTALWRWGRNFAWLWCLGLYELTWGLGNALWPESAAGWLAGLIGSLAFVHSVAWGGFLAGAVAVAFPPQRAGRVRRVLAHPATVWVAAAAFAGLFSAMSILQYKALMVPHGDTGMYEEHLWNLLHGKGFRSQLDDGRLFFGEHLEVIHLLLLPIYVLHPSLPTLNVCLSIALASGAIAVRGIARRLSGSDAGANWLAVAYLLYFPLQHLNLEASLKTFRPENFAVPLLLFAVWCLESGRLRTMLVLMGLALIAKEDYAIPIGMFGLFLAVRRVASSSDGAAADRTAPTGRTRLLGLAIFVFSIAYLWFVVNIFIPYFRGSPPHYMAYYPEELGHTPTEILINVLRRPATAAPYLFNVSNVLFVLMLLVPLAGLPLAGFGRLWLLLPSLGSILLIQLPDARSPYFHFHAPLVPVIFWAASEGLARVCRWSRFVENRGSRTENRDSNSAMLDPQSSMLNPQSFARFAAACALVSGVIYGKTPLSVGFYDGGSGIRAFGRLLYVPFQNSPERARIESFERLFPLVPRDAVVATTDFVRPRFTHHRECHQYGAGGLKPHVRPESIDYIIIDLWGPFSDPVKGLRMRELDEEPDRWEIVFIDPFFVAVKSRRGPAPNNESPQDRAP